MFENHTYQKYFTEYHPLHKFEVPKPYEWPQNISSIAYNPWIDLRKRKDIEALNLKFPWEKIPSTVQIYITIKSITFLFFLNF